MSRSCSKTPLIDKYIKSDETALSYLYNRTHSQYYTEAFKHGWTQNLYMRDIAYRTGEFRPATFEDVYQCVGSMNKRPLAEWLESKIKEYLTNEHDAHLYQGGGLEFFDITKKYLVDEYVCKLRVQHGFDCIKQTETQIRELLNQSISAPKQHPTPIIDDPDREILVSASKKRNQSTSRNIQPSNFVERDYQTAIKQASIEHFANNDKGILELPCGVGKTPISFWIGKDLGKITFLVGVPNTQLLKQWNTCAERMFGSNTKILLVRGNMTIPKIKDFLRENAGQKYVVITTYASSNKVLKAVNDLGGTGRFGIKINDEVHHLTTGNETESQEETRRTYIKMLAIPADKTLSLTATLKIRDETKPEQIHNVITNDDIEHFGKVIVKHDVLWAITRNIICDYAIQVLNVNGVEGSHIDSVFYSLGATTDIDKRLCLSAYSALDSISRGHSHHLLIYCNTKEHSGTINSYITAIITKGYFQPGVFHASYNSTQTDSEQQRVLQNFETNARGIITCVYCLGEGWDFPLLDGVVFAENMTSNIRILQSALRASRKNIQFPEKRAKIILPVLDLDEYVNETQTPDLLKVREVVRQMGMEDTTITQKLHVYAYTPTPIPPPSPSPCPISTPELGEYDDSLTKKIWLKTIMRNMFGIVGYEKARAIISSHGIKTKDEYKLLCENNNKLPFVPEDSYGEKFKSWIDYLSISREEYYTLDQCRNRTREYLSSRPDLQKKCVLELSSVCDELVKLDDRFPPLGLWTDLYDVHDLRDIIQHSIKRRIKVSI